MFPDSKDSAASPIAIIGMACRFPGGADNPERFWELLISGRDAVCEVPAERWDIRRFFDPEPGRSGKTQVREAGFLQQPFAQFDPQPFGISPREAEGLDPQQRLLLEVTWESLEDAGQDLARLRGSSTGVFMGGFCLDNKLIRLSSLNRDQIDQHTAASSTMTMLSNRISYIFDLRGPSLSLDTACSSSLVALDTACRSLWSGACDLALAGGVNVMLVPEYFIALSHARMLSPLGRCMAFDERAAGYARGEGCGVVALKPLARALADGDSIRAVIHATGVNQDGRTTGITLPNPEAQVALMYDVCRRAKIRPGQVSYVEAHGTGTRAGDKAELEALGRVMAEGRPAGAHCLVGAVKTNIGHLEAASGMAGLIKAVLVLEHRRVPPNLHLQVPNPDVRWTNSCLRLPDAILPLTSPNGNDDLPYAAVNSFGYGGTNAHVLLQAAPHLNQATPLESQSDNPEPAGPWLLPISACDAEALKAQAGNYAKLLQADHPPLGDILHGAAMRRTHLPQRLAVVGDHRAALAEALANFALGEVSGEAVLQDEAQSQKQCPVFVYSGMGPQWWGMGRELARREPVFREALEEVDALFHAQAGWSVLEALGGDEASSRVDETRVAQPANFALQVALTRLLEHWGIVPAAVVGHSTGEIAAAWSCDALSLPDAVTLALNRSQWQQTLAGAGGGMLSVAMTVEGAGNLLRDYPGVVIAAINAPRSLTLAGALSDLKAIGSELERYEVFHRLLQVDIPYHSPAMEAIREPLLAALADIVPLIPRLPWYSTVSGKLQDTPCDAHYCWKNVREPVRFQATVERMAEDGFQDFLEIGPHPVLQSSLREILSRRAGCWTASTLHRKQPESRSMLAAAAALHVRGYALNWPSITPAGKPVRLPTYPWQRLHYWKDSRRSREDKLGRPGATWLWEALPTAFPAWQVDINRNFFPWLNDHRVGGRVVFPGAAYVAAALAIQHQVYGDTPCGIEDVTFREMLVIEASASRRLVSALDREAGRFRIYSHAGEDDDGAWLLHAEGRFRPGTLPPEATFDVDALRSRCPRILDPADYYAGLAKLGLDYGPEFRRIAGLRTGPGEVLLELADVEGPVQADTLPPVVLDALFQGLFGALTEGGGQRAMVPVAIGGLRVIAPLSGRLIARLVVVHQNTNEAEADMFLMDSLGRVVATATGVRCQAVFRPRHPLSADWFHEFRWQELVPSPLGSQVSRGWLLVGSGELPTALAEGLKQKGEKYLSFPPPFGDDLAAAGDAVYAACQALLNALPQGAALRMLVFLDDHPASKTAYDMAWCHSLLALAVAQAAEKVMDGGGPKPVLCFVTRMTQSATADACAQNPGGAASWGLARVISNEIPGLICRLVDLGNDSADIDAGFLQHHLSGEDVADEIAFRQGRVFQLRLTKCAETLMSIPPVLVDCARHAPLFLDGWQPGSARPFWREGIVPKPGPNQAFVELDSWLLAPGVPAPPAPAAGLEWHGRTQIPDANGGTARGQRVWGLHSSAGSLPVATCMVVNKDAMWPVDKPEGFPEAVFPFLHAWHSLAVQGRVREGEAVLLHNASDSASMAWAEVASRLGARLLVGIADTDARPVWEGRLDNEDVLDASQLDYREQVKKRCGGKLNVVVIVRGAGATAVADSSMISPGGRVLVVDDGLPDAISGKLLAAGIQLLPCSLDLFTHSNVAVTEALGWFRRELAEGWQPRGDFPCTPLAEIGAALADARHGRFVRLDFNTSATIQALPADRTYCGLRRQASYLITGGTSGFGLALAEWLAGQEISHLVLVSRRGCVESADQHRLSRLREISRVTLAPVDVSDSDAVSALFAGLARDELPLRGVFHCAMVLSDGWLRDMDSAAMDRVLKPKVAGAMNLHKETQDLELDCFVLFSSVSALIGNPGQGAYAAANACLDGMAHWRRGLGLSALSINWGAIGDVGVAARDDGLLDRLRQSGVGSLDSAQALAALGVLLLNGMTQAGVFDMDWARWRDVAPLWPARFESLVTVATGGERNALSDLRRDLTPLEPDARIEALTRHLRRQLARILRQREEQVPVTQEVSRLGLDSLLTLEWVVSIHQEWGLNVSAVELLKAPSLADLAGKLLPRVIQ